MTTSQSIEKRPNLPGSKKFLFFILVLMIAATSCATISNNRGYGKRIGNKSGNTEKYRKRVVESAETYLGSKYRFGGHGPFFDCSGLVYRIYSELGFPVERKVSDQYRQGIPKKIKRAEAGDLIFFRNRGKVDHVAIITGYRRGKLKVIHSTNSKGVIEQDVLKSPYWKNRIYRVRDLIAR